LRTQADAESGPERTCIATGEKGSPADMLRFALSAEGQVTPDIRLKLPGRGVWTRLSRDAVGRAATKGAFSRAFRAKADAPAGLADQIDGLLERDALQSLAMANKAGLVVSGAFKVDSAIANNNIAALIEASDGAADGAAKRAKALKARLGDAASGLPTINLFSSGQLDLALGKANVIHAALKSGAAGAAFLSKAERVRRYRASEAGASANIDGANAVTTAATDRRTDELAERPAIRIGHERNEQ
jgi:predicted RNA-binding protein YlxR (DUF448 family)